MSTLRTDTLQTTDSSFQIDVADLAQVNNHQQFITDIQDSSNPAKGSALVGHEGGTLKQHLDTEEARVDTIRAELDVPAGSLAHITQEERVNTLVKFDQKAFRVASKAAYDSVYDHFGVFDITPRGELILLFRRGSVHTGGSDGKIAFRKYLPDGTWGPVTIVAEQAGLDFRAAGGGVMPSGRIIVSGTIWSTGDLYVYASDDYGDTWTLKQMVPKGSVDYRLAYGRAIQVGNKFVLPYYSATGSGTAYQLRWLETTDGGDTWVEGATIANSAINYNEAEYLDLGGGFVLGVSRIGTVGGGKFRQFLSTDGGTTWVDQGDVTAQNGDSTDTVVSPSLAYFVSKSGTPHVFLFYTNRTSGFCYYRTLPVSKAIQGAGVGNVGWSDRVQVYSAPGDSGYQSQIALGDRIIGNLYRELSPTGAGGFQFEVNPGVIPDYTSDWTAVSASNVYTFTHGLQKPPRKVVIDFATSTNPTVWNPVYPTYFNDGANKGSGAQIEIGATTVRVGTGSAVWGTGYFGGFDNNVAKRATSGYYKVRAYL
ncbi:hypothetical protein [Pseudomonas phage PP21]